MSVRALCLPALLVVACAPHASPVTAPHETPATRLSTEVSSNTTRADYAGSAACAGCHADEYASFLNSPMHNMTREIKGSLVRAPFAGEVFRFKKDTATMTREGDERFVTIDSAEQGVRKFRVTRVIGGRHREDFAGIEVTASAAHGDERILPVSYVIGEQAYRYKGYSVMTPERPGMRPGAVWRRTCIFCHNTVPFLDTALGPLTGAHSPYQGEVVDVLLPEARRVRYVVTDEKQLATSLSTEMNLIGAPSIASASVETMAKQAIVGIRRRFDPKHLVEVGIGCESCHGGSREHVTHFTQKPSFAPVGVLSVEQSPDHDTARAASINRACARCHQVLFTGYPFTWEGGRRSDAVPGGSHISSGEARDFLLGACAEKLHCARCHDPHAADGKAQRAKFEGNAGNALCVTCHEKYATSAAVAAHTHHDPDGAGAVCMDCHMPKKNMSLDMKLSRYHRIGSPNDPARVERDRPLECALCHADKRVGELVDAMERWWGKRYDRGALQRLYGAPTANVLRATVANGKAHEQAAALYALGAARDKNAAPLIAAQLTHPYPILRYYARDALRNVLGDFAIDLHTDSDAITRAASAWLARAGLKPLVASTPPRATPAAAEDE